MKSLLLIVLLAAAATSAVVSNEVTDVVVSERADRDDGADVVDVSERADRDEGADVVEVSERADRDDGADVARSIHPDSAYFQYGEVVFYIREVVELPSIAEVRTADAPQRHLNEGISEPPVPLLTSTMVVKQPAPRVFHIHDVYFSFKSSVKIVGIQAIDYVEEGTSATIRSGGLGSNNVTIRFQSPRSRGYAYQVYIYGD